MQVWRSFPLLGVQHRFLGSDGTVLEDRGRVFVFLLVGLDLGEVIAADNHAHTLNMLLL